MSFLSLMFLFLLLHRAFITKPLWIWRLLPVSHSLCLPTTPSSLFFTSFLLWKEGNVSISRIERMAGRLHHLERIGAGETVLAAALAYMHEQTWRVTPKKKTKKLWRYACTSNSRSPIRFQIRSSQMDGFYEAL